MKADECPLCGDVVGHPNEIPEHVREDCEEIPPDPAMTPASSIDSGESKDNQPSHPGGPNGQPTAGPPSRPSVFSTTTISPVLSERPADKEVTEEK